jgi:hypothetical protein
MFSRRISSGVLLCSAAPIDNRPLAAAQQSMAFGKRYAEKLKDPKSVLAHNDFHILQDKLTFYKTLQGEYAVKQDDIERAKRAANMCGLDMLRPKGRVETPAKEE